MRPTETLKGEHRVIEQVLDCVERMTERCEEQGRLDGESATQVIDFLRNFADRCHHGKEEDQLFPAMELHGFSPNAGPTGVMRVEHEEGRRLIRGMESAIEGAAAGKAADREAWRGNAREYVALLRAHIQKEDHCLFPMAEQALDSAEMDELRARFDRVDRDEFGDEALARYRKIAGDLADRFGVARSGSTTPAG